MPRVAQKISPMTNIRETPFRGEQGEPSKAARPLRIIVADDDQDTVLTLTMVLRHEGHDVRGVDKGSDVGKAVEEFNPDALLVDINMPDLSGYEVARRIRSKRAGERLLLIAISGVYKKGSDRVLAQLAGFDHHLSKPYEASDVLRLLERLRNPSDSS